MLERKNQLYVLARGLIPLGTSSCFTYISPDPLPTATYLYSGCCHGIWACRRSFWAHFSWNMEEGSPGVALPFFLGTVISPQDIVWELSSDLQIPVSEQKLTWDSPLRTESEVWRSDPNETVLSLWNENESRALRIQKVSVHVCIHMLHAV